MMKFMPFCWLHVIKKWKTEISGKVGWLKETYYLIAMQFRRAPTTHSLYKVLNLRHELMWSNKSAASQVPVDTMHVTSVEELIFNHTALETAPCPYGRVLLAPHQYSFVTRLGDKLPWDSAPDELRGLVYEWEIHQSFDGNQGDRTGTRGTLPRRLQGNQRSARRGALAGVCGFRTVGRPSVGTGPSLTIRSSQEDWWS